MRSEAVERWIETGRLDPDCETCKQYFLDAEDPSSVFAPRHQPSGGCRSGAHPHCTCDTCF